MDDYLKNSPLHQRYKLLNPILDERLRRLWAAAEALALGTGGITILAKVTGLSRTTIQSGMAQLLTSPEEMSSLSKEGRVRRPGAGRKSILEKQNDISRALEALIDGFEPGGSPLLWTCKSTRTLREELCRTGLQLSYRTVGNLLHHLGYTLAGGETHRKLSVENRVEQFRRISRTATVYLHNGEPVLSVRIAKAKSAKSDASTMAEDKGSAKSSHSIPPDSETASLASSMILSWWRRSGRSRFLGVRRILLVTEVAGRPAGDREIWVPHLLPLARHLGCEILVAHFPPGIRRWKESRLEVGGTCSIYNDQGLAEDFSITLDLVLPAALGVLRGRPGSLSIRDESFEDLWNYTVHREL